jgi:hypothetical protein
MVSPWGTWPGRQVRTSPRRRRSLSRVDREDLVKAGYLQDPPNRWRRPVQDQGVAGIGGLLYCDEHAEPGRVHECDPGQIDTQRPDERRQRDFPGRSEFVGVRKIDVARNGEECDSVT